MFGFLDKINSRWGFIGSSLVIRMVEAVGNSAFLTSSFSIIAKEFPNNVATTFAILETFFGLGKEIYSFRLLVMKQRYQNSHWRKYSTQWKISFAILFLVSKLQSLFFSHFWQMFAILLVLIRNYSLFRSDRWPKHRWFPLPNRWLHVALCDFGCLFGQCGHYDVLLLA